MAEMTRFILSNFSLSFLVIGLLASGVALARARKPLTAPVVIEALFAYFLLFSIGFAFFYNFVMHTYFDEKSARFIGWASSPFQAEVGFASLGFAVVGILAFRGGFDLRLAAVVGPAIFLLGAAGGHLHEMITAANFAPGNAGVIFYMDIVIPMIGAALLWQQYRTDKLARNPCRGPMMAQPATRPNPTG